MKHVRPFFLISIMSVLLMTGFGCKGTSTAQLKATKTVNLEYWTVFDDVDAIRTLVEKYRQTRPFIRVTVRQLRPEELYSRLTEALAEDQGPDIISVNVRNLPAYQSKLAVMPASVQDTTQVVVKGQFNDETVINTAAVPLPSPSQIEREYVQTVKNDVIRGGRVYGLPLSLDTMGLFYNKDVLDAAGVAEPPKTWEEFQVAVKKITKFDKQTGKITQAGAALGTGSNVPGSDDLLYVLFRQSQLAFVDKNGRAVFNAVASGVRNDETPAMGVVNFLTDFANPTRDTYTWNDSMGNALDQFTGGSLGFFFGYSFHYPVVKARAPQLNFDVLPLLQLNPEAPANVASYAIQSVVLKSKHQNEAWGLINYLTHSSATKTYLEMTNRPTALRTYISAQSSNPALLPFIGQLLITSNWYRGNNYEAAMEGVNSLLKEWLVNPPNPDRILEYKQQVLNRAAAKINQTL